MIVERLEHRPQPCPEGCWPGHTQAGRVLVGSGVPLLPERPDESLDSVWVSFPSGPDGPGAGHIVRWNGRMTDAQERQAVEMARQALRAV